MRLLLKILPLSLILLLAEGAGAMPGQAGEAPAPVKLVMFIAHADVPPYYLETADGQGRGILMDVLRAVAGPLGYEAVPRRLPDKRGWHMLEYGGVDVYATAREWIPEPDRFLWTGTFMPNEDVLLYRAGSAFAYDGPESLHGMRVAGIKGFVYPALESHFGPGGIIRLDTTTPEALLELLALGRADAVLVNRTEILWMFRNREGLEPHRFRMDETPVGRAHYRFVFPKGRGWEPVIDLFNRRLREMKRDGSLKAILDRYR
ncbi:extracellular solute-binding protein family 3 [Pseudodesulfovibrio mercurii]|uniref:Extracellular solute-binding protein family 3 n=1 Tax=Pseudodesulfovibrio mercurii TaxID=641491 RepID=F0JGG4_9BACT|nr:transporter substrate-binding domain-containing protein [Pseudodesulfovibrio mercurii]EGB15081.1 extracellular solute-binding protein family 3 [Pseudodesulfovibrio mercurii]